MQHVEDRAGSGCSFVRRLIAQVAAGCSSLDFPGARLKKALPTRELMSLSDMVPATVRDPLVLARLQQCVVALKSAVSDAIDLACLVFVLGVSIVQWPRTEKKPHSPLEV